MAYYCLVKKISAKNWRGAFPIHKGISKKDCYKNCRMKIRKNYKIKIINKTQLKNYLKNLKVKLNGKEKNNKKIQS